MLWSAFEIAAIAARALRGAAEALDTEQSPRGLDALDELALHPILADGLAAEGLGVLREQPYPGAAGHPIRRERERCDLVLTDSPGLPLRDPVSDRRERRAAVGTLFERHVAESQPPAAGVPCDEAFWLEVKVVGQFCFTDGVPGPNPTYVADMTACLSDLAKLARDPIILHAAAVTIVFSQDERTLRHDFAIAVDRAIRGQTPIGGPGLECFAITDRIGNAVAGVGVIPLRKATVVWAGEP